MFGDGPPEFISINLGDFSNKILENENSAILYLFKEKSENFKTLLFRNLVIFLLLILFRHLCYTKTKLFF